MPQFKELSLSNLQQLDLGTVDALFTASLRQVLSDLNDRPFDKTKRKIKVEFSFSPVPDSAGRDLEEVGVEVQVTNSLPKSRTKTYRMIPKLQQSPDGRSSVPSLAFSTDFADDPHQDAMFDPKTGESRTNDTK